jgi:hypothetical protein
MPQQATKEAHRWGYAERPAKPGDLGMEWRDYERLGNVNEWFHFRDDGSRPIDGPAAGTIFFVEFENESLDRHRSCRHYVEYLFPTATPDPRPVPVGMYYNAGATRPPLELSILLPKDVTIVSRRTVVRLDGKQWEVYLEGETPTEHQKFLEPVPEYWSAEREGLMVWTVRIGSEIIGTKGVELVYQIEVVFP